MPHSFECRHRVGDCELHTRCVLLPGYTLAGPAKPGYFCEKSCRPTWNGEPSEDSLPGIIAGMRKRNEVENIQQQGQPSWTEKLRTAAAAVRQFVSSGGKLLSKDDASQRMQICRSNGCGQLITVIGMSACNRCGCFLRFKTRLPQERCPLALWPGDPPSGCGGCGNK